MAILEAAITASGFRITEVVSGMADRSPDMLGVAWARQHMVRIARFPARWGDMDASWVVPAKRRDGTPYNKVAGLLRNQQMAEYAAREARGKGNGQLLALWDGKSPGTRDMIARAHRERLTVFVHMWTQDRPVDKARQPSPLPPWDEE